MLPRCSLVVLFDDDDDDDDVEGSSCHEMLLVEAPMALSLLRL